MWSKSTEVCESHRAVLERKIADVVIGVLAVTVGLPFAWRVYCVLSGFLGLFVFGPVVDGGFGLLFSDKSMRSKQVFNQSEGVS